MAELTQTSANVLGTPNSNIITAGETINAGMPFYKDAVTGLAMKSRSNALATAKAFGIALNNAAANQPLSYQRTGRIKLGATLTDGETYGVSADTAGKIFPLSDYTTGDYPVILGIAEDDEYLQLTIIEAGVAKA